MMPSDNSLHPRVLYASNPSREALQRPPIAPLERSLPWSPASQAANAQSPEPQRSARLAQAISSPVSFRGSASISDNPPLDNPSGLHERVVDRQAPSFDVSLPQPSRFRRPLRPMEHDQQPPPCPPFSTPATDPAESIEPTDPSDSISAQSPVNAPRSRSTRLSVPPPSYRPSPSQPQNLAMGNPYYAPQGSPAQQPQQYMAQPLSPAIYFPSYPHPQATPSNTYNVNQSYLGPPHTTVGPPIPVAVYAYSPHAYGSRVSDPNIHPYPAYHRMGGMTAVPISHHHHERDSQRLHPHGTNLDTMPSYGPMIASSAPSFGYTVPAYAPTSPPVFTPQYANAPSYHPYVPQQSHPYPLSYRHSHPVHRPPSLDLSQQPNRQTSSQDTTRQASPSPHSYPPTRGYSPIVASPSPGLPQTGFCSVAHGSSGASGVFTIGSSAAGSSALSARSGHPSAYGNSPSGENSNRSVSVSGSGSSSSILPSAVSASDSTSAPGQTDSDQGRNPSRRLPAKGPSRTPHGPLPGTWPARPEPSQLQGSGKAERSEWVMWVGNVPGDATTEELEAFFQRVPPAASEDRASTEVGSSVPSPRSHASTFSETERRKIEDERGADVASVFLISRSNCAFVNYASEEALNRGVERCNGKPLRPLEVDPRCPKLVCRIRKKGDDLKAGVGGQRGVGIHAQWVREKQARSSQGDGSDIQSIVEVQDHRPSLHPGRPAIAATTTKKSSSSSSTSYASTTSSLLAKHFPVRYFILKSLTQHDLDISVERGLWATQTHNEETLDTAYRTSQTVYLIFSVNKSGEFFGYARMDGPIKQVEPERTPSVEWASRDTLPGTGSSKTSPVNARAAPSQPTIREGQENVNQAVNGKVPLSPQETKTEAPPQRFPSMPAERTEQPRLSREEQSPNDKIQLPPQHASEPSSALRQVAAQVAVPKSLPVAEKPSPSRIAPVHRCVSPKAIQQTVPRLLSGVFQESPDPLTPGEDRRLHSLDARVSPEVTKLHESSPRAKIEAPDKGEDSARPGGGAYARVSAPAEMAQKHKRLSVSTPITPPDTWDECRGGILLAHEQSIEEEEEEEEEHTESPTTLPTTSRSLPPDAMLASNPDVKTLDLLPSSVDPKIDADIPVPPGVEDVDLDFHEEMKPGNTPLEEKKKSVGGREEGWGTPFKVRWIRTDALPFHRTRHLRNPWNHDREVKVSRDGTEIEPSVGQRLIEEWDQPDVSFMSSTKAGLQPRSSRSPINPSRGWGRGRAPTSSWSQTEIE